MRRRASGARHGEKLRYKETGERRSVKERGEQMVLQGIRNIYTCHAGHLMPCILDLAPYTSNLVPFCYGPRTIDNGQIRVFARCQTPGL